MPSVQRTNLGPLLPFIDRLDAAARPVESAVRCDRIISGVANSLSADEAAVRVTNSIVRFGNDNANDFLANMQPAQKEKIMAMTRSQARPSEPH